MISIIIPFFNVGKYLRATLESVEKQTYTDFEVIMIDDGSADEGAAISDEFAAKDSRFKVTHIPNGGVAAARNLGLSKVTGEYIYFLDGDDIITPDCLELLYNALSENNADMAQGNFKYVDDDMNDFWVKHASPIKDGVITGTDMLKALIRDDGFYYVMSCNKLCRKELFDGIEYPVGKIHEDHFAVHRLAYKCKKIACVKKEVYYYIKHGGSITMKPFSLVNLTREEAMYDRCRFLNEHGLDDIAADTAYTALRVAPRVIQRCYTRGLYSPEVEKRLLEYFTFEYSLCNDKKHFPVKKTVFKIILELITKHPSWYIAYLKAKYTVMKPPQ